MQTRKPRTKSNTVKLINKKTRVFGTNEALFNDARSYEYHLELSRLKAQSKREDKLM